jgi:hypothetical protein
MGKKIKGVVLDLSSFMCVILMLIGVLMIMLISNVLTIISNPENVTISAVIKGSLYAERDSTDADEALMLVPKFGNKNKEPVYIDVYGDQIVLYPEGQIVPVVELERAGNAFERLLSTVALRKDELYIVLLARPRSARVLRRLRTAIHDRQVDMGFELYEEGRTVDIASAGEVLDGLAPETPPPEGGPGGAPAESNAAPAEPTAAPAESNAAPPEQTAPPHE